MMSAQVAMCIDEATCRNPGIIGLEGEALDAQQWLAVFANGEAARKGVGDDGSIREAWVVSSDDVEPINLAATLKGDRPELVVRLVAVERCGSLFSRAHTALIDEVIDASTFLQVYADAKRRHSPTATGSEPLAVQAVVPVAKAGRAFLMPVVSGSGGAGKSSVAVMCAFIARSLGFRTLLLDYDLQFGDAAVMAGVEAPLAIDEALARPDRLERELLRDPGLAVLAAPARLEAAEDVVRAMPAFLDELSTAFDVIVANTGAAWAEQHAVLLERSSAALFLIDQRASSIRACAHALELCSRCGIASGPFQFAVNRCSKTAPLTSADVSSALQGTPVFELKDGGRDVEEYLSAGAASDLLETRNDFCTSLEHVLASLMPNAPQRPGTPFDMPESRRAAKKRGRHSSRKWGWGSS